MTYRRNPLVSVKGVAPGFTVDTTNSEYQNAKSAFEWAADAARGPGTHSDPYSYPPEDRQIYIDRCFQLSKMFPKPESSRMEKECWGLERMLEEGQRGNRPRPAESEDPWTRAVAAGSEVFSRMAKDREFNVFVNRWLPSVMTNEFVSKDKPLEFPEMRRRLRRRNPPGTGLPHSPGGGKFKPPRGRSALSRLFSRSRSGLPIQQHCPRVIELYKKFKAEARSWPRLSEFDENQIAEKIAVLVRPQWIDRERVDFCLRRHHRMMASPLSQWQGPFRPCKCSSQDLFQYGCQCGGRRSRRNPNMRCPDCGEYRRNMNDDLFG